MRIRARDLQPGDVITATGEVVQRVSRGTMTRRGRIDIWLDRRHAEWNERRLIEVERSRLDLV